MAVYVSTRIRKKEFGNIIPDDAREVILRAARTELMAEIAGRDLPAKSRLYKAYATSPGGARRIVFLFLVDEEDLFLLLFRDKNDPIGKNITMKNPSFAKTLSKYLTLLLADIAAGRVEEISDDSNK